MANKKIKIPTKDNLANVALFYLSRFAASEESLRKVLANRVRRAAMAHTEFAEDKAAQAKLYAAIDEIVEQHKLSGVINDAEFARIKTNSMRRSGRSSRDISQRLRHKGVAGELIDNSLSQEDGGSDDMKAALIFAKKRRIPALLQKGITLEQKRKEFAAFARAGFSYDISKKILGGGIEGYEELTDPF